MESNKWSLDLIAFGHYGHQSHDHNQINYAYCNDQSFVYEVTQVLPNSDVFLACPCCSVDQTIYIVIGIFCFLDKGVTKSLVNYIQNTFKPVWNGTVKT
jgi:hypothetical protein